MSQKIASGALVAVTIAVVASLLTWLRPQGAQQSAADAPRLVEVGQIVAREITPNHLLTGRLQPTRVGELRFEVAGRVVARDVEAGARVRRGQALLQLDDGDYRDALVQAQTRLELIEKKLERDERLLELAAQNVALREREVARIERLGKQQLASPSLLDAERQKLVDLRSERVRLTHAVEEGKLNARLNRSLRDQARRNLDRTTLHAPFAGTVNKIEADVGDYVGMDKSVAELVVADELDLFLNVSNEQAAALELGLAVEVTVGGRAHVGTLVSLQTDPNRETYTRAAKIRLQGRGLQAGASAQARLPGRPRAGAVVVPVTSIQYRNGQPFVFVAEDAVVLRRRVVLGRRNGDEIIIERGLTAGEHIVLRDVEGLGNNQKVLVKEAREPAPKHTARR